MKRNKVRLLYLLYNENLLHSGILRSQVIKLLEQLSNRTEIEKICLLSFVNPVSLFNFRSDWKLLAADLKSKGVNLKLSPMFFPIRWNYFTTLLAMVHCMPILLFTVLTGGYNTIHSRSYIAGLFGHILQFLAWRIHIFDPRGPMPEEMAQNGYWLKGSPTFKFWKSIESKIIEHCSAVIAVTPGYKQQFKRRKAQKSVFIPNRGDVRYFVAESVSKPIAERPQFLFIGEMDSYWNRPELVAGRYSMLKTQIEQLELNIVTRMDHEVVKRKLIEFGIDENDWNIQSSAPKDIPSKIAGSTFGYLVSTIHPEGVWPVKMAEYLACGIPLAVEGGTGSHMTNIVEKWKLGIVLRDSDNSSLQKAAEIVENLPEYSQRCREFAEKRLDISRSADQYLRLYKQELKGS